MSEGKKLAIKGRHDKRLLRALAGETLSPPPWWLMRQAGRYLPEYRAVRSQAPDFVALCLNPALAAELTLQPLRRFRMDAAILFSDILLLPHALGQKLEFREGEGPVLEPIGDLGGVTALESANATARLDPVFETLRRVRAALDPAVALIGFAGSPWTVAAYMVEGGGSRDFVRVKSWAYRDPAGFAALIELLTGATIELLAAEIEAGAEAVQLFDSWAGILPEDAFERWIVAPTRRIAAALKTRFPEVPIIGFARGAGVLHETYATASGLDAVGLDTSVPADFARRLQEVVPVQGNLDPVLLATGGTTLDAAVTALCRKLGGGPHVFNLGHGVLPQTPPENVARLARLLAQPPADADVPH